MNGQPSRLVEFSTRVYQHLLWLYPAKHREEYGWMMLQLFRDKAYDTYHRSGFAGITAYWIQTLLDLMVSVIRERQERALTVSDETLIGLHPYLLLGSGVLLAAASVSQLQPDDHWNFYGVYALSIFGLPVALITFVAGLYGLRDWFYRQAGLLGQLGMGMSILGGTAAPFFIFMLPVHELIWGIMMIGFIMLFCGIALAGIDMLGSKNFPLRISTLMIVSGITPFIAVPVEPNHFGPRYISFAGMLVVGICWLMIGNYLRQRAKVAAEWKQPSINQHVE